MSKYPDNQRLKLFREHLNISQGNFANALNLQQGSYSDVERGKASVSHDLMYKIISIYRLNPLWFYTGEGEMFVDNIINRLDETKYELVPMNNKLGVFGKSVYNIPIFGSASAGYFVGHSQEEQMAYKESYNLAIHKEQLNRGFMIYGDSMMNELNHDDAVFCRRVLDPSHHIYKRQSIYVMLGKEGIVVKHLLKEDDHFLAISANTTYAPYKIPFEEIWELWMVDWQAKRRY